MSGTPITTTAGDAAERATSNLSQPFPMINRRPAQGSYVPVITVLRRATGYLVFFAALTCACFLSAKEEVESHQLWNGEKIDEYAKVHNLPEMLTVTLGNGMQMELRLIPSARYLMGTRIPEAPLDTVLQEKWVTAVGVLFLVLIAVPIFVTTITKRGRPQISLARFLAATISCSVILLGLVRWRDANERLARYHVELSRFNAATADERPEHEVTLAHPFYLGTFLVTQEQYAAVTGKSPSKFSGKRLPVESLTFDDAREFCKQLSNSTGMTVRLPREAEWEFACRAGSDSAYYTGESESDLGKVGWYKGNSGGKTHDVGLFEPNAFGLYDMHGNVLEWCEDRYLPYRIGGVVDEPAEDSNAMTQWHVMRGGCWYTSAITCRSRNRCAMEDKMALEYTGMRIVIEPGQLGR